MPLKNVINWISIDIAAIAAFTIECDRLIVSNAIEFNLAVYLMAASNGSSVKNLLDGQRENEQNYYYYFFSSLRTEPRFAGSSWRPEAELDHKQAI